MNIEKVIAMAREAGIADAFMRVPHPGVITQLERFAELVRNDYNNKHSQLWRVCIEDAVKAEREACAKVCDDIDAEYDGEDVLATWCAKAIRARGSA